MLQANNKHYFTTLTTACCYLGKQHSDKQYFGKQHIVINHNVLINQNGEPRFGHFDTPITELGVKQFVYRNLMDKPANALAKYLHFKQFQFVSISHPDWQIGIAIADIRYAGSAFCYFFDRRNNVLDDIELLKPFSIGVNMSRSPTSGTASINATPAGAARSNSKQSIAITLQQYNWQLTLDGPLLRGELTLHGDTDASPLALCTPTGYNGWTYTQKHNGLPVSGNLNYRGATLDLTTTLAGYDYSAGYMRRETSWRWGSISAQLPQGRFGLNLANGVNETGTTENCLWLNGIKQLLAPVSISLNRQQPDTPWHFVSADQRLNLQFQPSGCRQQRLNLGILASNFRQYCGVFSGEIWLETGEKLRLNQVPGLAEDHFARW